VTTDDRTEIRADSWHDYEGDMSGNGLDGTVVGNVTAASDAVPYEEVATCYVSGLAPGVHTIVAEYTDSSNNYTDSSASVDLTVPTPTYKGSMGPTRDIRGS
jgi:hypothetical protein